MSTTLNAFLPDVNWKHCCFLRRTLTWECLVTFPSKSEMRYYVLRDKNRPFSLAFLKSHENFLSPHTAVSSPDLSACPFILTVNVTVQLPFLQ